MPLHTFQARTLSDLDHALYLLNFDRIELGLSPSGDWSVYYRYPCRFLDRTSNPNNYLCTIHATDLQPGICVHYNPYRCWYKKSLTSNVSEAFLRIDRRRMDAILQQVRFDDERNIVDVPDWPTMMTELAALPLDPAFAAPVEADPVFEQWLRDSAAGPHVPAPLPRYRFGDFVDPCTGCSAACCTTLVFPYPRPQTRRNVDYLQFVLGFPGLEVGVSDGDWQIVVKTRCRHLTADSRCGIYGKPERPTLCKYFDAAGCSYVARFGLPRPKDFMRVRLEQFFWMVDSIAFDPDGVVVDMPQVERMRLYIEHQWRATLASLDAPPEAAAPAAAASAAASAPEAAQPAPAVPTPSAVPTPPTTEP
ncbi:MAG: hypothetical protein IT370_07085 [Deltaproteobacteria bacterium]|nr:hypothetical protein [Deltaproteobacteria bacterium]